MDFYDQIAAEYDRIVAQGDRAEGARRFVASLAERHALTSAVDVACGTGLYAQALAEHGADVVAADISEPMLQQARLAVDDPRIRWVCAPMQALADHVDGPVDAVLCMGNSLPHLLTDDDLAATLAGFHSMLAPGGVAVVQLLNYHRLLATGERIVGATRSGDSQYLRFYDFGPDRIQFNVLEMHWTGAQCEHRLHQTPLRPLTAAEVEPAFTAAGFVNVQTFGGLDLSPFVPTESDQLLLIAHPRE
ncbi:MAG: class I SAM-dependent methyltransferase [Planctomycetota bacterium]